MKFSEVLHGLFSQNVCELYEITSTKVATVHAGTILSEIHQNTFFFSMPLLTALKHKLFGPQGQTHKQEWKDEARSTPFHRIKIELARVLGLYG